MMEISLKKEASLVSDKKFMVFESLPFSNMRCFSSDTK